MALSKDISVTEEYRPAQKQVSANRMPVLRLQEFLNGILREKTTLRILEAGCGSASQLSFPDKQVHMTGIDISQKQLDRNHGLDLRIRADLQSYSYQPASYDVIVCSWVLEHLPRPDLALEGFVQAIDQGGLIVLAVPNVLSVKGLLTKYTPFPLHVWVYRRLHGLKSRGQDDTGPFQSYLRFSIRPNAIRRFAERNGLRVVYFAASDILDQTWAFSGGKLGKVMRNTYKGLKALAKATTFGRLSESDFFMVLQKCS